MRKELVRRYKTSWAHQDFRYSVFYSIILFTLSLVVFSLAEIYATSRASNFVEDIILSNTPVFDVEVFFVYGALALITFIAGLCLTNPKQAPFILYALTLFIFIRSIFVSLTHLGPFPGRAAFDATQGIGAFFAQFMFGGDLFFSGHTGIPFLMALLFWEQKILRYIFLTWSIAFGITVLLGHLHYSIDVLAAFFITYTIYQLALWLFPKNRELFLSNL